MDRYYYPYYGRLNFYDYMNPYRYRYEYPHYRYPDTYIRNQLSNISQQIYNAGYMAGVTQSAISNNIIY